MKYITAIICIAIISIICACHKDTVDTGALIGKWKLSQRYASAGGPGSWVTANPQINTYVQFDNNGKLEGTAFPDMIKFAIKDSVTLTFYKSDYTEQYYTYSIKNNVLEMSPAGPIFCIEGCGDRFTKTN